MDVTAIPGVETVHPRSSWNYLSPYPVKGPPAVWSDIDTAVIHYTAADDLIDGDPGEHAEDLPRYIASIQTAYAKPKSQGGRGYSIGYLWAVDWLGGAWQLRGWEFESAANLDHNDHTLPILVLVDGSDPATRAATVSIRALIAEGGRRAGRPLAIVGHGSLYGATTACPGLGLRTQIRAGLFTPQPDPDPPVEEDEMPIIFKWEGEQWDCIGAWDPATGTFPWRGCPDASKVLASGMAKRAAAPFPASSKDDPMYQRVG